MRPTTSSRRRTSPSARTCPNMSHRRPHGEDLDVCAQALAGPPQHEVQRRVGGRQQARELYIDTTWPPLGQSGTTRTPLPTRWARPRRSRGGTLSSLRSAHRGEPWAAYTVTMYPQCRYKAWTVTIHLTCQTVPLKAGQGRPFLFIPEELKQHGCVSMTGLFLGTLRFI